MATTTQQSLVYKILLLGDAGVGKTTFVKRLLTGAFESQYVRSTEDNEEALLTMYSRSNTGPITFNIVVKKLPPGPVWGRPPSMNRWPPLQPPPEWLKAHYQEVDAVFIMFDWSNKSTCMSAFDLYTSATREVGEGCPVVLLGNKWDMIYRNVQSKTNTCGISVKKNWNLMKPFLDVAREITGDNSLLLFTPFLGNPTLQCMAGQVARAYANTLVDSDALAAAEEERKSGLAAANEQYEQAVAQVNNRYKEAIAAANKKKCMYLDSLHMHL